MRYLFGSLFWIAIGWLSGCDPLHTQFAADESPLYYQAKQIQAATQNPIELSVMSWNIKFGGGRIDFFFDCHGDRVLMEEREVLANLEGLAAKIEQVQPDVLLLQELDINSKRSAFVDQLQWLLDHTYLNYGVYASQWRADFIPSDGLGAMDSGNAILSRWPLSAAIRIPLALRQDQDALTQYFYLKRCILQADVEIPEREAVVAVNVHTAAYGQDGTKRKHIERFSEQLLALEQRGVLFVAGGDLNTVPPGSIQLADFDDSVCSDQDFIADDYRGEVGWLDQLYDSYQAAIDLLRYQQDNSSYFSHTTDKDGFYNRKLDYLFSNGSWVVDSGLVHQSQELGGMATMPLSDHAPLSAVLELP